MSGPPYRPTDAQVIPRFAGIRTFMRAPHVTDLAGVDAAVYGIPFDTTVEVTIQTFHVTSYLLSSVASENFGTLEQCTSKDASATNGG